MSTLKNVTKKAEKSNQDTLATKDVETINKPMKKHSSQKTNLTWAQRAKLAEKGVCAVLTEFLPFKPRVRNKNAAIFSLNSVKHLPFAEICIDLDDKHEKDILSLYRLTNSEFLEVVF